MWHQGILPGFHVNSLCNPTVWRLCIIEHGSLIQLKKPTTYHLDMWWIEVGKVIKILRGDHKIFSFRSIELMGTWIISRVRQNKYWNTCPKCLSNWQWTKYWNYQIFIAYFRAQDQHCFIDSLFIDFEEGSQVGKFPLQLRFYNFV